MPFQVDDISPYHCRLSESNGRASWNAALGFKCCADQDTSSVPVGIQPVLYLCFNFDLCSMDVKLVEQASGA